MLFRSVTAVYAFTRHRKGRFEADLTAPETKFAITDIRKIAANEPQIIHISVSWGTDESEE